MADPALVLLLRELASLPFPKPPPTRQSQEARAVQDDGGGLEFVKKVIILKL